MLPDIHHDVVEFVMSRWQASGGFGFVPTLPASVEDTYHAVRILETILPISETQVGRLKKNQRLKDFLGRREAGDAWALRTLYQYLYICHFCTFAADRGWLDRFLRDRLGKARSLQDHYYLVRLRGEFPENLTEDWPPMSNGCVPEEWRTAEDLSMRIYIHRACRGPLPAPRDRLVEWLQACQTPDGGFGGVPGSTSFIENTHWCLEALALLGSAPLFPDRAQDFILRCKKRGGGFARKSGGAPFLYATWHAVAGMAILRDMGRATDPERMQ